MALLRLTRSTLQETLYRCIDGQHAGATFVPRDADMSATEPMWLGRDVTYAPALFHGKLAELRVFNTALPCPSP